MADFHMDADSDLDEYDVVLSAASLDSTLTPSKLVIHHIFNCCLLCRTLFLACLIATSFFSHCISSIHLYVIIHSADNRALQWIAVTHSDGSVDGFSIIAYRSVACVVRCIIANAFFSNSIHPYRLSCSQFITSVNDSEYAIDFQFFHHFHHLQYNVSGSQD